MLIPEKSAKSRVLRVLYPSKSGIRVLIPEKSAKSRVLVVYYSYTYLDRITTMNTAANRHLLPEDVVIPTEYDFDQQIHAESIASVSGFHTALKSAMVEPELLLMELFSKKEAETSSRIEGTDVTFEDIALEDSEERGTPTKRSSIKEARGVIDAIEAGKDILTKKNLPISNRVIKVMHSALMKNAVLDHGVPGEFRKEKVRVGVRYFPPEPQYVENLMSDFEKYIHSDTNTSPMVKIAILHAQFEIIHPFSDGNGRIGRLLIPFLMREYGLTDDVSYFISQYFERYRSEYYNSLENITKRKDWNGWIHFFLQSVVDHGNEMKQRVESLITLYTDGQFLALKNIDSQHIKNYIFKKPVFTVPSMVKYFEDHAMPLSNKNDLHRIFAGSPDIEVLSPGKGKRQTRYACPKIMEAIMHR